MVVNLPLAHAIKGSAVKMSRLSWTKDVGKEKVQNRDLRSVRATLERYLRQERLSSDPLTSYKSGS